MSYTNLHTHTWFSNIRLPDCINNPEKIIEKAYSLNDYPEIRECLIIPESLESRTLAFWVKEEMKEKIKKQNKRKNKKN